MKKILKEEIFDSEKITRIYAKNRLHAENLKFLLTQSFVKIFNNSHNCFLIVSYALNFIMHPTVNNDAHTVFVILFNICSTAK